MTWGCFAEIIQQDPWWLDGFDLLVWARAGEPCIGKPDRSAHAADQLWRVQICVGGGRRPDLADVRCPRGEAKELFVFARDVPAPAVLAGGEARPGRPSGRQRGACRRGRHNARLVLEGRHSET